MTIGTDDDVSPAAAVPAVGSAFRDMLLAPETHTADPPMSCFDVDAGDVNELHAVFPCTGVNLFSMTSVNSITSSANGFRSLISKNLFR